MKIETVKLNKKAMQLVDEHCFAAISKPVAGEAPQLDMLAYSGGIIKDHWYWGDLSIDLQGMSFPKKKFPLLEDHNTSLKIGFATKMSIENNQLTVANAEFVDTPESLKFRETSAQGFPYEASIYAKPTQIQTLQEDEVADVNGFQMKGPGTIWRKSIFKEASVCTFGYDSNTKSAAMSDAEEDVTIEFSETKPEVKLSNKEERMDYLKFKTEHPEEFAKLSAEVLVAAEAKFAEEKKALVAQVEVITEQNTKLTEENKGNEKRLIALEKADAIRAEQALKHSADAIFAEKFKEAGLPERLSEKVRKLTSHNEFVVDGKLDIEAFSAAIDAELKDWTNGDDTVLGFSAPGKTAVNDDKATKESDAAAARMLSYLK